MKRLFLSLCLGAAISLLHAFTFSPISQDFSPQGKNSNHIFTITNTSLSEKIAVKVSVVKRIMAEDGTETLEEAPGDFLIYPSRNILNPGEKRNVRIKWQGGSVTGREKAYRVIAEQIPVEFNEVETPREDGGGIKFSYRYEGSLYVVPEEAEPSIELIAIESVPAEGESFLKLIFENTGERHAILSGISMTLSSRYGNFDPIVYESTELKGVAGENVLAGNRRYFLIPQPPQTQGEELLWEMTLEE